MEVQSSNIYPRIVSNDPQQFDNEATQEAKDAKAKLIIAAMFADLGIERLDELRK